MEFVETSEHGTQEWKLAYDEPRLFKLLCSHCNTTVAPTGTVQPVSGYHNDVAWVGEIVTCTGCKKDMAYYDTWPYYRLMVWPGTEVIIDSQTQEISSKEDAISG
jgi:hypothetical protein